MHIPDNGIEFSFIPLQFHQFLIIFYILWGFSLFSRVFGFWIEFQEKNSGNCAVFKYYLVIAEKSFNQRNVAVLRGINLDHQRS